MLKIEKGVELPETYWKGQPHPFEETIGKMKVNDSVGFDNYKSMVTFVLVARRFSRRQKKGEWRFRQSEIEGFRVWRTA